jgi:hypothetical protein
LRKRTISWLSRYGFPRGPTYYLDPEEFPSFDVVEFKKSVLLPLKQKFPNLKIGIGNDQDDLESYKAAGLRTLLITGKPYPGATCVPEWSAVDRALATLEAQPVPPGPPKK